MEADWNLIFSLSERLGERLRVNRQSVATAESCTGGGIGYAITQIPGSSDWYQGGVVAYSNQVKINRLCVESHLIDTHGAVSIEVVEAMARGTAKLFESGIAMSTSGIAGPDGGTVDKPVGTVCFGWYVSGRLYSETKLFEGDRESIRLQSIAHSLSALLERL